MTISVLEFVSDWSCCFRGILRREKRRNNPEYRIYRFISAQCRNHKCRAILYTKYGNIPDEVSLTYCLFVHSRKLDQMAIKIIKWFNKYQFWCRSINSIVIYASRQYASWDASFWQTRWRHSDTYLKLSQTWWHCLRKQPMAKLFV